MSKPILFIINPVSGTGTSKRVPFLIDKFLKKSEFAPTIKYTEYAGHATEICNTEKLNFSYIVAVGGDGTVNEIAKALQNSDCTMGIIPCGSGNGLAYALGMPLLCIQAIQEFHKYSSYTIDTGLLNGHFFANVAGLGFDAHVAHKFANFGKRGIFSYGQVMIREFRNYPERKYKITFDNQTIEREAFVLSIANSSQFGNHAHIAPTASLADGLLDLVLIKKFSWLHVPDVVFRLFSKNLDDSPHYESFKSKHFTIETEIPTLIHLDGEPMEVSDKIEVSLQGKLKILGKSWGLGASQRGFIVKQDALTKP